MIRQCRDCPEHFTLSPQQLNFQRLVKGRRDYVLCPKCNDAAVEKKWALHLSLEVGHEKSKHQKRQDEKARAARQVRKTLRRM